MEKVIYTVLTGGYDHLAQPESIDPSFDYVCFTDCSGRDGVWELREIPYRGTALQRARWAKLHPHLLLPEYRLSVFMDANLCITDAAFYAVLQKAQKWPFLRRPASPGTAESANQADFAPFGVLEHPERDCVWEELRYCYLKDKLGTRAALYWHRRLEGIRMPRHTGLAETNILLREHGNKAVVELDELWWKLLLESGGMRDQLCFTPALQLTGLRPALLFGPGLCARNVPYVRYTLHPVRSLKKTFLDNVSYRLRLGWRKLVLLWLK